MDGLDDIAVFLEVVDAGSFTAAAEKLNLSRPVVSKYVSRLEKRLGARLLNRTTRTLSLTEAGDILYQRSAPGLAAIAEAQAEVSRFQSTPTGTLKLNVPMSFGIAHIAPLLPGFLAEHPGISVDLQLQDQKLNVVQEGFDASIRISELTDSSLVARRLGPCRHVVVAAPSYLAQNDAPATPPELRQHATVTYQYQDSATEWVFRDKRDKAVSVKITGRLNANNSLALREMVLGGAGIARMPTFMVGEDIRAGRMVQLLPGYRSPEPAISLVYAQRRYLSPKVRAFLDYLLEHLREPFGWDEF